MHFKGGSAPIFTGISNLEGTEITVYEPKASESHTEGTFYVGLLVNGEFDSLPEGAEFLV